MFGLSKREQRWKAEQRAAELLAGLATAAVKAAGEVRVAELKQEADLLQQATATINMQLQTIKELEAQIPSYIPGFDEHKAFEETYLSHNPSVSLSYTFRRYADGSYCLHAVQRCWRIWQARADITIHGVPKTSEGGQMNFVIGGKYNWKHQPERLVYLGHNWSGNGYWHQFALVSKPNEVWCEVLTSELQSFEESKDA